MLVARNTYLATENVQDMKFIHLFVIICLVISPGDQNINWHVISFFTVCVVLTEER